MSTVTLPATASAARPIDLLLRPLKGMSMRLAAWKARRRRRADAELLMHLEPHMLRDIGVVIAEPRGASAILSWHPALLATVMGPNAQTETREI